MWSRARAIAGLREVAANAANGVGVRDVQRLHSNELYQSLLHHFGSLDAAREAASVSAPPLAQQRWSEQAVVEQLQKARRAGVRLTVKGLSAAGLRGLANAAREYCGGLPRARKLARVPEPAPKIFERVRWDEDTVISDIRALRREGKPLARSKAPSKLVNAAQYYFGGWREAVEAAGFDYDRVRLVREPYERDELLAMLRDLAHKSPTMTLAALHDHTAAEAWKREFGSIEDAACAAGLEDWPARLLGPLMSPQDTIAAIRERVHANQSLKSWDIECEDRHLQKSGIRHFGSWHEALVAAEISADALSEALGDRRQWTKTLVVEALRQRRRSGKSMSPGAIRKEDSGLFQAARSYLGYDADIAVRDWGAERIREHWTKRKVIAALRDSHATGERLRSCVKIAALQLFGSMGAARTAARLPLLRTEWTDQRVIEEIRALAGARPPGSLVSMAQGRFGSWRAALAAAGVPAKSREWDAASIAQALAARLAKGQPLDPTALRREDSSLYHAVRYRYGNVARTVNAFIKRGALPKSNARATRNG